MRILVISDFTESFAFKMMKGILNYSRVYGDWEICRMPPEYKKHLGIDGVVNWAKKWGADAVIGQFDPYDKVELFAKNGIVAVAQDYKKRFANIANITADYHGTGRMAAEYFIERGFKNYAFFGLKDVCWSDERYEGFRETVEKAGFGDNFQAYRSQDINALWYYERDKLSQWLNELPKPVAIMACDDNQGANLLGACGSIGIKSPQEVAIIGVDNDEVICNLNYPTLSSIRVNIERGGYETAALIDRLVNDVDAAVEDVVLKPEKVIARISSASYGTSDVHIQKAIRYIHENLQKKVNVNDIVNILPYSRRLLERRFKEVTGKAVYQYYFDEKLQLFANLLVETSEPIINLAINIGETDSKGISRKFKEVYGCTPNEWREKRGARQEGELRDSLF